MTRRLTLAALAALLTAGTLAATEAPGSVFMWKVEQGGTTVHLLGSIHALKAEAYPLPAAIEKAFEASEVVVFEVDLDEMTGAALEMLAAGSLEAGQNLEATLGPELWAELAEASSAAGIDPAMLQFMKPWMAALSVAALELSAAGYLPAYGLDSHFSSRADEAGKRREALETVAFQIGLFNGFSPEQSAAFLRYTLADLESLEPVLDELYRHWRVGEVGPIAELMGREFVGFPELHRTLIADRNRRWLPRIEALLAGGEDALVVVGALHLVGDEGLVALLRQRGYTVTQQ
jgi:uncharacterized protein YbaP (TraB family)